MKKRNYFILAATLLFSLLLVTQQGCKKDKNEVSPSDENGTLNIPEETKAENISVSKGGTISFENGLKLEVPANALNSNTKITIQTFKPYSEFTNNKSNSELTGPAVSQIVVCEPSGTNFSKPVKLTIPYYPELLPDGYSESDLLFLSFQNGEWDTLNIHIDQEKNLAYAFVNHFSTFKIVKHDHTNWTLFNRSCLKLTIERSINNKMLKRKNGIKKPESD